MHLKYSIAGGGGFVLVKRLMICAAGILLGIVVAAIAFPVFQGILEARLKAADTLVHDTIASVEEAAKSLIVVGHIGPVGHAYGIAAGGSLASKSPADIDAYFDELSAAGAQWVRFDIAWSSVQPQNSSTYNWDAYDRIIADAISRKIQVLGIIDYTPAWARAPGCAGGIQCPPKDPAQFAAFAAEVVKRYQGKGVHYWEIWNEENSAAFWAPAADCKAYTALLKPTYTAIKNVDPYATIILGGLAPQSTDGKNISPTDFLTCVYKNGGKGYFTAVAHHPYTYPQLPSSITPNAWKTLSSAPTNLHSIMGANDEGYKQIWLTEFGAPTWGPDKKWFVTEALQAQILSDGFARYQNYDWAGPIFVYSLRDSGTSSLTNENFFGLERFDGSKKPAYTVFKNAATTAASMVK